MEINVAIGISATAILAVLSHGAATIWWASKVSTTMGFIRDELKEIKESTEIRHRENKSQLQEILNQFHLLRERVLVLEEKIK